MPLCVYLCYAPGCQTKLERWMPTAEEGKGAIFECPRCGAVMQCAWTGSQIKTPNLKDAGEIAGDRRRRSVPVQRESHVHAARIAFGRFRDAVRRGREH